MTNYHTNPSGTDSLIVFLIDRILVYKIWKLVLFFGFQRHIWSTGLVMFWKLCLMTATWIQLCTRCVYLRATKKVIYWDELIFNIPVNCEASALKGLNLLIHLLLKYGLHSFIILAEAGIWLNMKRISKSNSDILMREGVLHQHSEICKALGFMCVFCLEVELGKKNWLRW